MSLILLLKFRHIAMDCMLLVITLSKISTINPYWWDINLVDDKSINIDGQTSSFKLQLCAPLLLTCTFGNQLAAHSPPNQLEEKKSQGDHQKTF